MGRLWESMKPRTDSYPVCQGVCALWVCDVIGVFVQLSLCVGHGMCHNSIVPGWSNVSVPTLCVNGVVLTSKVAGRFNWVLDKWDVGLVNKNHNIVSVGTYPLQTSP